MAHARRWDVRRRQWYKIPSAAAHIVAMGVWLLSAQVAMSPAVAQDSFADAFWQFRASAGFDYSSGMYGARTPTEIWYVPVTLRASKGPWSIRAVMPWLWVSGPALLIDASADAALGLRAAGFASGPGDFSLYGTYSVESLYDLGLFIDLTARLKAPTASFDKGLGTGEWDGAFQVDVSQVLGDFMPFATLGYKIVKSPPGFKLRNVVYGTAGLQYTWNDRITTGIFYDVRQASIATAKTPQEGTAYVVLKLGQKWTANIYATAGFSPTSPSGGGGLSMTYRWP